MTERTDQRQFASAKNGAAVAPPAAV